jgi:hypothetical protein
MSFVYKESQNSRTIAGQDNKSQTLLLLGYLRPVLLRARDHLRAGASGTDVVRELCSGCMAIWLLGSIHATAYFYYDDVSRLSATTTLLRRRHGRSIEFIHRRCWVSVSIFSLYLLVLFFCQLFNMHV